MNPDNLSKLSNIALQYGPFFFSVLFVTVVMVWGYKVFKETNSRKNPPATAKELSTARMVFLGSFFFTLLLVIVSVVWWLGFRQKLYAFHGEIVDLQEYETLAPGSENIYFRNEPKEEIDGIPLRNEHFMIIQGSPFSTGQSFEIEFSKNKSTRNKFEIVYDPSEIDPKYKVDWDDNLHTNVLRREGTRSVKALHLGWTVYAAQAQEPAPVYQGRSPRGQTKPQANWAVAVLQDSSSDVGSKINALDALNNMPAAVLTQPSETGHEPALATLLDLTRYSDKEVSYKASQAVQRVDLDDYLVRKLNSNDKRDQQDGQAVLLRLDQERADRVLQKLNPSKASQLRPKTSQAIAYQVVPTASPQGDRYYVKATWNPRDESTVDCLTNLFHNELINNRSLDQERAFMKSKSQRLVYWYDKDWSISIAAKIRTCGGNANFVQAGAK